MNPIAEEIESYFGSSSMSDKEYLEHYGMPRRSGRYPWGSGNEPYQHSRDFLGRVEEMRKSGFTYTDPETGKKYTGDNAIAKSFEYSSTDFRTVYAIAKDERRAYDVARAKSLKEDGLSTSEIGRKMGVNESTVRSYLNPTSESRMKQARETADFLKKQVDEKGMIDVGHGVNNDLRISKEKLDQALFILQAEGGYEVYGGRFEQVTNKGQMTTQRVLCKPGTPHNAIYDLDKVKTINDYISRDDGQTFEKKFHYPESLDSKRLQIRYKEDGGIDKDGVVELRRNVPDLSLGESRYSQVRIMVDGTHYIKGMAVYSDDMPPGVDVIFNTNKSKGTPMTKVLKEIKPDPDNPFGSLIKDADQGGQYWYTDPKTGQKKLGLINKRSDEGDWTEWKDALPSQFLSKQSITMAKKQLDIAKTDKQAEFDEIMSLTNPTIKKYYLNKFAQSCDSAAVHMQAAALPGQKYHVILPVTSMSEKEVYAPGYKDGSKLALIRYPHGGTFEIPIVTVNNKNKEAIKMIGKTSIDAIGINSKVAERLSGADFDGDTVMCIPTNDRAGKVKITSTHPLDGLKGFDPKMEYGYDKVEKGSDGKDHYYRNGREFQVMKKTDTEMGKISNLITDMTLAGAKEDELARAVRHSMVVIDAEKHKLDYKQSEVDNNISALRKEYQAHVDKNGRVRYGGASTLISRAKGEYDVDKRQGAPHINIKGKSYYDPTRPEGALIYKRADDADYIVTKIDKRTGEEIHISKTRTQKSTRMAETDNAYSLVSEYKHPMELVYADYANSMKNMANQARVEMTKAGKVAYNKDAKKKYEEEVRSLDDKLLTAESNIVRERAANRMAAATIKAKKKEAEEAGVKLKNKDIKKDSQRALSKYREEVGSISRKDRNIQITDKEWEAIQAGAISESKLKRILNNSDPDSLRQRAMPKTSVNISQAKINRIKAMSASYTVAQIADKLGISTSTVSKYLKEV